MREEKRTIQRHMVRPLAITVVALVLAWSEAAVAQTTRTDFCVRGIADVYRFNAAPVLSQHEFRLYADQNNPGMLMLLFDSDNDVVGAAAGNDRFLFLSTGLIRGQHRLLVACVRSARYSVGRVNGNEKALSPSGYISLGFSVNVRDKDVVQTVSRASPDVERRIRKIIAALTSGQ